MQYFSKIALFSLLILPCLSSTAADDKKIYSQCENGFREYFTALNCAKSHIAQEKHQVYINAKLREMAYKKNKKNEENQPQSILQQYIQQETQISELLTIEQDIQQAAQERFACAVASFKEYKKVHIPYCALGSLIIDPINNPTQAGYKELKVLTRTNIKFIANIKEQLDLVEYLFALTEEEESPACKQLGKFIESDLSFLNDIDDLLFLIDKNSMSEASSHTSEPAAKKRRLA